MVATKYIDRIVSSRLDVASLYVDGQEYVPASSHGHSPYTISMPTRTTTVSCTASMDGDIFAVHLTHEQCRIVSMMVTLEGQVMIDDDFGSIIHRIILSYKNDQYTTTTIMSYITGEATINILINGDYMYISGKKGEYQLNMLPNVSC